MKQSARGGGAARFGVSTCRGADSSSRSAVQSQHLPGESAESPFGTNRTEPNHWAQWHVCLSHQGRPSAVAGMRRGPVPVVAFVLALGAAARGGGSGPVTCGSVVKLLNVRHNVRLHSHDVRYGSGSGQQSVTGVSAADDGNSYWRVRGRTAAVCERGQPVRCGQAIRLTHLGTGRNLHSHHFVSPLSGNQEVSAFGEDGEGDYLDDWTVLCSGTYWARDSEVRFQHASTDVFLSVTGEQYGRPINGQREVHGMATSSQNNYWKVMEGIFMQPGEMFKAEQHHVEL